MYWGVRCYEAETARGCFELLRSVLVETALYSSRANAAHCFVWRDIGCIHYTGRLYLCELGARRYLCWL